MGTPCLCEGKIDEVCQRQQGPPFVNGRDCTIAYHWHNTPHMRLALGGPSILNETIKVKLPCIHEGTVLEFCTSCGSNEGRHVRDCDIHNKCTRDYVSDLVHTCSNCKDNPDLWHYGSNIFLRELPPYSQGKWSGKGIVICGGGPYWPSVYVTVKMLRHVGCGLPIQVWCFNNEWDRCYGELLTPYGVEFVDIDSHSARQNRRMVKGFGVKLFAVVNSPFEEVLSLDADNYPCVNPTVLFEDQRYVERGGIYWPDRIHTDNWTKWPFWGIDKFGPACGFETGQFVLHKRKAYEPMMLAEWYDDHADSCYATNNSGKLSGGGDYGDKGPHRVAWARLRREPAVFNTKDSWKECGFLQVGPDGQTPMFVHRCQGKFVLDELKFPTTPQISVNGRYGFPKEEIAFGCLEELRQELKSQQLCLPERLDHASQLEIGSPVL